MSVTVEDVWGMTDEELRRGIPELMESVDIDGLVRGRGRGLSLLVSRLDRVDVAEFDREAPEASERFQRMLWEIVEAATERSRPVRREIEGVDLVVDFDATDSSVEGRLEIDGEKGSVSGYTERSRGDEDLSVRAPSDTLVGLFTGSVDPVEGYRDGEFELGGGLDDGRRTAVIIRAISEEMTRK